MRRSLIQPRGGQVKIVLYFWECGLLGIWDRGTPAAYAGLSPAACAGLRSSRVEQFFGQSCVRSSLVHPGVR